MTSVDVIRRLHEHRAWVNHRLRDAAAALDEAQLRQSFEIGRGNVWATLIHLYGGEYGWLEVLQGNELVKLPGTDAFMSLAELNAAWDALERRWRDYLAVLDASTLDRLVARRVGSDPAGPSSRTPALDVLLHVCTHTMYTAAQCVNMLRHLGAPIPNTMLITLSREQHQEMPT